ncbi:MAG: SPASM domain-containing protein [Deltaproteobacteria bacterium]|nr:SPASM domain-containing protein [Deltaproteobacteria bacterium]
MPTLTRYLRLFQVGERRFVESLVDERAAELDGLLHALLRALARGETAPEKIARQVGASPDEVQSRIAMLRDLKLVVDCEETDRNRLRATLSVPSPTPATEQVELTNACPMQCLMCPRGQGPGPRPVGFMDLGLFRELLPQIAEAQRALKPLALHNLGESLLHPRLDEFVQAATQAGLPTELSVNPGLLPLERYVALAAAGLSRLVLSLDGLDAATLESVRGTGAQGAAAQGHVAALLEHRARAPSSSARPELIIQMLRMRTNAHQHADFLSRYSRLELPGVSAFLKDLDANTRGDLRLAGDAPRPYLCRAPWRTVVVLWDGKVVPCCHDPWGEWILGDLRRQRLDDIWRSDAAERLRLRLRTGWPSPDGPCGRCAHRPDQWERPDLDRMPDEPLHW